MVIRFTSPRIRPRVIKAPTGILIAAHGSKAAGRTGISQTAPVESISLMTARMQRARVKPAPVPRASMRLMNNPFLLAIVSARQMMMQFTTVVG